MKRILFAMLAFLLLSVLVGVQQGVHHLADYFENYKIVGLTNALGQKITPYTITPGPGGGTISKTFVGTACFDCDGPMIRRLVDYPYRNVRTVVQVLGSFLFLILAGFACFKKIKWRWPIGVAAFVALVVFAGMAVDYVTQEDISDEAPLEEGRLDVDNS